MGVCTLGHVRSLPKPVLGGLGSLASWIDGVIFSILASLATEIASLCEPKLEVPDAEVMFVSAPATKLKEVQQLKTWLMNRL